MLESRIAGYIEQHQLLPAQGNVVVAVSGGADSLCLLHVLHRLCGPGKHFPGVQLHVAHLNHQLRGEASEQDALAVSQLARSWHLPVTIGTIDVRSLARQEQRSLEDAARTARYRFLRQVAQGEPIAVAHHQDDQVETLLLHWLRGGGLASMVGLQARQQDIIRPLLCVGRADTVAYCEQHQLRPLEDASNSDPRFLRNRIRHELVPLLDSLQPGVRETLLRNAEVMRVDLEWLNTQVEQRWPTVVLQDDDAGTQLSVPALLALPLSLQRHLLRQVTARLCAGQSPLELRHYLLLEQLLQRKQTNESITLHLPQQLRAIRSGPGLLFTRNDAPAVEDTALSEPVGALLSVPDSVIVPGTTWIASAEPIPPDVLTHVRSALRQQNWDEVWHMLPATPECVYVDADHLWTQNQETREQVLLVRTRQAGDRMQPLGMAHEKKIQDILVDKHIPRGERARIPLFLTATHCVWLAGITLDERVRLTSMTHNIVRLTIKQATV